MTDFTAIHPEASKRQVEKKIQVREWPFGRPPTLGRAAWSYTGRCWQLFMGRDWLAQQSVDQDLGVETACCVHTYVFAASFYVFFASGLVGTAALVVFRSFVAKFVLCLNIEGVLHVNAVCSVR